MEARNETYWRIYSMRAQEPRIILRGTKLAESGKAIKFCVEEVAGEEIDPKTEWFPFSQVDKIVDSKTEGTDFLHVSQWICQQKGLV